MALKSLELVEGFEALRDQAAKTRAPENLAQIIDSITGKLFTLGDAAVYPGHGDDGTLKSSKEEYAVYASKEHPADLSGDVEWTKS